MTRSVFITGTNSGIGKATVELFAGRGWNVAATVRRPELVDMFQHLPNVRVFVVDVTDHVALPQVMAAAVEHLGRIDVLVNNAGYFQMGPLETSTMEQIRAQYETNCSA